MSAQPLRHRWWRLAVKIGVPLLLGLILLETGLRVTERRREPVDPEAALKALSVRALIDLAVAESWIREPGQEEVWAGEGNRPPLVIRRNGQGCREDTETPLVKPPGTYRVVVLGDSHTDGSVENADSYANVLERLLPAAADVMNCGQAVSSPYQQLWIYRTLYRRFDPDLVVIGFFAGNDLLDLMFQYDRIHLERVGDRYEHARPTWRPDLTHEYSAFKLALVQHSALCRAVNQLGWLQVDRQRKVRSADYYWPLVQAKDLYGGATWQGLNQAYYFKHHPQEWQNASDMLEYVLAQFKKVSPRDGMILLVIPTLRQLHPDRFQAAEGALQLSPAESSCDERVCDLVLGICRDLQVPAIDLRPVFRDVEGELYWDSDQHINREAHRIIAEQLLEWITANVKTRPTVGNLDVRAESG